MAPQASLRFINEKSARQAKFMKENAPQARFFLTES